MFDENVIYISLLCHPCGSDDSGTISDLY